MGVVYHVHYLNYFEEARTEALRTLGMAYKELEESGVILPVVDLAVKYSSPAEYDEVLIIDAKIPSIPMVKFKTEYDSWVLRSGEKIPVATGSVTLAFVDAKTKRPMRAPESVTKLFQSND